MTIETSITGIEFSPIVIGKEEILEAVAMQQSFEEKGIVTVFLPYCTVFMEDWEFDQIAEG